MYKKKSIDISIVIVNYNVKEFVAQLFESIYKSVGQVTFEIILIDNNSIDNSIDYLKKRFPEVIYIENKTNVGFGKANNQGFAIAKGTYTFILNPDTIIEENTLSILKDFMDNNTSYGSVGCKLLNPDGSFAPESRRQEPNPISALGQTIGLTKLFPSNKTLAGYYMNWLTEDAQTDVEVLSGACMFYRTSVLKELNGFDEQFFMYGEDIDLCKRTRDLGYKIAYLPDTSIIHYKGESTKKDNIDYVVIFNKAMYQYFLKHYSKTYSYAFKAIIVLGIIVRGVFSYFKLKTIKYWPLLIDLVLLNVSIIPLFIYRYSIPYYEFIDSYKVEYLFVNLTLSAFYIMFGLQTGLYTQTKFTLGPLLKTVFLSVTGTIMLSFIFKDYAFSRLILIVAWLVNSVILIMYRVLLRNSRYSNYSMSGLSSIRVLLVGVDERTAEIIQKFRSKVDWNYEIVGLVLTDEQDDIIEIEKVKVVGSLKNLNQLCTMYAVDQVIFTSNSVSTNEILRQITVLGKKSIHTKLISEAKEFIIGKSNVDYLDDVPVMDIELAYNNPFNVFLKRTFDLFLSIGLLALLSPLSLFLLVKIMFKSEFTTPVETVIPLFKPLNKNKLSNFYLSLFYILVGKMSFVGSPIYSERIDNPIIYKVGLTGLRQINEHKLFRLEEKQHYELHYLKFYTIWLDIDILLKKLLS